jgi:carbamoyltransferase
LIDRETNPSYFRILQEYHKVTGLPCLINTSFNLHEEPIVCSPEDAIRAFREGNLDYLAMGNFLFKHPGVGSPLKRGGQKGQKGLWRVRNLKTDRPREPF